MSEVPKSITNYTETLRRKLLSEANQIAITDHDGLSDPNNQTVFLEQLMLCRGNMVATCKHFDISVSAVKHRMVRDPNFSSSVANARRHARRYRAQTFVDKIDARLSEIIEQCRIPVLDENGEQVFRAKYDEMGQPVLDDDLEQVMEPVYEVTADIKKLTDLRKEMRLDADNESEGTTVQVAIQQNYGAVTAAPSTEQIQEELKTYRLS